MIGQTQFLQVLQNFYISCAHLALEFNSTGTVFSMFYEINMVYDGITVMKLPSIPSVCWPQNLRIRVTLYLISTFSNKEFFTSKAVTSCFKEHTPTTQHCLNFTIHILRVFTDCINDDVLLKE